MTKKEAFEKAETEFVLARARSLDIYKELAALKDVYARAKEEEAKAMYDYFAFVPLNKVTDTYIETLAKFGLK